MAYLVLLAAIALEVAGTSLIRSTAGFTRLWPTVACLACYALAFLALAQAVKQLQVGVAYALWAGVGTAAIVAIGVAFLHEPISWSKAVGIVLIVAGVVVLNLGDVHRP